MKTKLRISARQSELARYQAYQVGEALQKANPQLEVEYLFRESLGDKNLQNPLWKMPEKGVFTEDFYLDLVEEKTEMVVHSWKDLPTQEKPDTYIAATLPRADQRDFLLFKKSSRQKKNLKFFSSSPRRIHNLKDFFSWALPSNVEKLEFESVRGNIPTRVRKWLADDSIDGLVLAKAALDRLLDGDKFPETRDFLRETLNTSDWMVLPLSYDPNAAAQGALAVEIKQGRSDVADLLKTINCEATFSAVEKERQILQAFGGGCHLALGMSYLKRSYGDVKIVRGLTPDGQSIFEKVLVTDKALPANVQRTRLEFQAERKERPTPDVQHLDALYVAKADAWTLNHEFKGIVWTAGCETWKKLAARGVWVHGSSESLGEVEDLRIEHFFVEPLKWGRLSHSLSQAGYGDKQTIAAYDLSLSLISQNIKTENTAFIWTSPQEFDLAVSQVPDIQKAFHICGPGRTYEVLRQRLGSDERLFVELLN
ncbi:hydroxymethylbilane synthase [Pseudobdellovibrio exovorus]|uniref:Hydroxymethylbilane synthase n=1 Tax=Pseudobdellovibrio exovorus JSS TaxID=1184267 RepID=M4V907_9BACT|nr:hydroxymethylbilane synthase [Pseudobdellovibrio exovorus]AGH95892.1 hydroxymethylbilane synthase [Pseudobdellovibrio exovorus JSS]